MHSTVLSGRIETFGFSNDSAFAQCYTFDVEQVQMFRRYFYPHRIARPWELTPRHTNIYPAQRPGIHEHAVVRPEVFVEIDPPRDLPPPGSTRRMSSGLSPR